MKTSKAVVPVFWFRVAVASQLFMEGAAGYLLFSLLREVTRTLEPDASAAALDVLSLIEVAYFAAGALFLGYCCLFAKPPSEDNFTNTKWWMVWALQNNRPQRYPQGSASASGYGDSSGSGGSPYLNPTTGLSMIGGTLLDTGGNVFGESSMSNDSGDMFSSDTSSTDLM